MPLYKVTSDRMNPLKTQTFEKETELQSLVEKNIEVLLALKHIKSEFSLHGYRIDSVAFDEENNSFAIIEYKKGENYAVSDQGLTYLNLMLTYKKDFEMLLLDVLNRRVRIDWSQSKVIFISNNFNEYQIGATGFRDLPIELWKYTRFDGNLFEFEEIKSPSREESISSLKTRKTFERVGKEIKTYTLEDHLQKSNEDIREIYHSIRNRILNMDNQVKENIKKKYIAFRTTRNFVSIILQKNILIMYLDIDFDKLNDPQKIAQDYSRKGHWGTGDTKLEAKSELEIPYAMNLIKQSYDSIN